MSFKLLRSGARAVRRQVVDRVSLMFCRDFEPEDIKTIRRAAPYTLTSIHRLHALVQATKYVIQNGIEGDFVECGVWKGGSMLAVAETLQKLGDQTRTLHLFDTFAGMTKPGELDVAYNGKSSQSRFEKANGQETGSDWCNAGLEEVRRVMRQSEYPDDQIKLVPGMVEDSIPGQAPKEIALLRLDTDWYESTRHEMIHLFPRLAKGGILIIDDYGHWVGARRAVDEYLAEHQIKLFLNRIDYSARLALKG